ncbi:hypothetical protein AAHC03_025617 [Spirometra sp. Aus1]
MQNVGACEDSSVTTSAPKPCFVLGHVSVVACPKHALLLSWLSSNTICTGQSVDLNCSSPAWQEISTNYLGMYPLPDIQTDAPLMDWVRNISDQDSVGNLSSEVRFP